MRVQTFRSEFAVERLDEGVVSGLSRSGEVERDAAPGTHLRRAQGICLNGDRNV